ncbi:hypothetical protein ACPB9E_22495 [Streptomyces exfoliatus]|uniref:hypothetical protein n=1 Tax=Streptomyces exfoliatus TaxID=1905 RepID=UPI003C2E35A8
MARTSAATSNLPASASPIETRRPTRSTGRPWASFLSGSPCRQGRPFTLAFVPALLVLPFRRERAAHAQAMVRQLSAWTRVPLLSSRER